MVRRLDRGDAPTPAERVALDEAALEKRYRTIAMFGMACDPPWPPSAALLTERHWLDATGEPVEVRLAALERWLAARGLLDAASAFADRHGATTGETAR